jgi:hypothetical protein
MMRGKMSRFLVPHSGNNLRFEVAFTCLAALFSGGCMRYRPLPIEAPNLEARYRARNLAEPGLRRFILTVAPELASEWPPRILNLGTATLAAAYFNPKLDLARSQIGKARAGMITAGAPIDPSLETEPGYNSDPQDTSFKHNETWKRPAWDWQRKPGKSRVRCDRPFMRNC